MSACSTHTRQCGTPTTTDTIASRLSRDPQHATTSRGAAASKARRRSSRVACKGEQAADRRQQAGGRRWRSEHCGSLHQLACSCGAIYCRRGTHQLVLCAADGDVILSQGVPRSLHGLKTRMQRSLPVCTNERDWIDHQTALATQMRSVSSCRRRQALWMFLCLRAMFLSR